jgi:hypothetical protein
MKYKFLIPLICYLLLVLYSYLESPYRLTEHVPIPKLLENKNFYEGKYIYMSSYPVESVSNGHFMLRDWDNRSEIKIASNESVKKEDIVTAEGYSFLISKGFVEAEQVEVQRNYWWKVFLAPLGLLIVGYYLIKERFWREWIG